MTFFCISTKIHVQGYSDILCVRFDVMGFRWAQTMAFAIDEINRNPSLLPNVTLGYSIYDNCLTLRGAFRSALSLVSGREKRFQLDESCVGSPPVLGIVGDGTSKNSIAISSILGLYRVPMVNFPTSTLLCIMWLLFCYWTIYNIVCIWSFTAWKTRNILLIHIHSYNIHISILSSL